MIAPIAAEMTSPIKPGKKAMPNNGKMIPARIDPKMPMPILPSSPKPPPFTAMPASQPAAAPTMS